MNIRFVLILAALLSVVAATLQASTNPPFTIQTRNGVSWLVRPGGERFFSLGVCVVDQGAARGALNPTNPGYAAFQHYENSNRWAEAVVQRLKGWGFTTIGGWSDFRAVQTCPDSEIVFTPVLHTGSTVGMPWWDMWDSNLLSRMHRHNRDWILPLREDRRLLGYYSDNEMGWWNAILFKMTLEHAPTSEQRRRLIQLLRRTYHNQWAELLKDFDPEGVGSFEELDRGGLLYLRPGSNGIHTYRRFLSMMAERYYSLVREVISKYDPRGLILGDRYQSFYYPEVARMCGPHVDAVSANLNGAWNDGTFPRFYLDTLHALTGKPIFVSEFYMAANENRSGNKNSNSTFPTVATQKERVEGFRTTVQALLDLPYVVGADWFQYYDEPTHGRSDGEDFNFGLVDIYNQPYEPLTAAATKLEPTRQKQRNKDFTKRPDASAGVPPSPADPLGQFTILLALKDWDRERGFVKPISDFPTADLYVCWDSEAVYLGLYAQDIVEKGFYRDKIVPEVDRAEWVVALGKKAVRCRLGPGGPAVCSEPAARLVNLSGIYMDTRNVAALKLPATLFGKKRFQAGDKIELASTVKTHSRTQRVDWKGKFKLSR